MIEAFSEMTVEEADRFMLGKENPQLRKGIADLVAGRKFYDLGCGKAFMVKELYTPQQYAGIDVSDNLLAIATKNNPDHGFRRHNLASAPLAVHTGNREVAILVSVLEHLPDLETAQYVYGEAARVCNELIVVWHTPPIYDTTEIVEIQAELDRPINQNRYARGSFDREDLAVRVGSVEGFEFWRVTCL
jgi:SAM-dependent methyltransferase